MTARLVLCAGIPRSGSTWLYNAARLGCLIAGGGDVHAAWIDDYDPTSPAIWHVVKVHDPAPELESRADVVLTSRRDLRDIAASVVRRGWAEDDAGLIALLGRIIAQHDHWSRKAALEVVYADIQTAPVKTAGAVLAAIGLEPHERNARAIVARIEAAVDPSAADAGYDPLTLLHPGHRAGGGRGDYAEVLEPALIERIEGRYGDWLERHGYVASRGSHAHG